MHGIHGPARSGGRDGGEERRVKDAKADFLALHVAIGHGDTEAMVDGVAVDLGPPAKKHAGEEQAGHDTPDRPTVRLVFGHAAKVVSEAPCSGLINLYSFLLNFTAFLVPSMVSYS